MNYIVHAEASYSELTFEFDDIADARDFMILIVQGRITGKNEPIKVWLTIEEEE